MNCKNVLILSVLVLTNSTFARSEHLEHLQVLNNIELVQGYEKALPNEKSITLSLDEIFRKVMIEASSIHNGKERATHAKGVCFDGRLKVYTKDELQYAFQYSPKTIDQIRQSFFKNEGEYPLEVRFANAKGQKNPDTTPDVRAISFSIDTNNLIKDFANEPRLDFIMNSSPMFAVNNIVEFHELMKTVRTLSGDFYFINPLYLPKVKKAADLLKEYERNDIVSFATENYWSNVPYVYGRNENGSPREIAKFKVTPCESSTRISESSAGKAPDYLQTEIKNRVTEVGACFYLQVQIFNKNALKNSLDSEQEKWTTEDWIENGGEHWKEEVLPFYTIAKISLKPDEAKLVDNETCTKRYYNTRIHGTKEIMPIGSLSRVRAYVEERSRARRLNEIPAK